MGSLREAMAHAFALEPEPRELADGLPPVIERAARAIASRGLETPAILALESLSPLGFLGGQAMIAAWPIVQAVVPGEDWLELASLLEDRRTLRRFAALIERIAREQRER